MPAEILYDSIKMCYNAVITEKEAVRMPNEKEIAIIQKAAMFDLIQIIKKQPDKTYTVEELEALIVAYVTGAEQ